MHRAVIRHLDGNRSTELSVVLRDNLVLPIRDRLLSRRNAECSELPYEWEGECFVDSRTAASSRFSDTALWRSSANACKYSQHPQAVTPATVRPDLRQAFDLIGELF